MTKQHHHHHVMVSSVVGTSPGNGRDLIADDELADATLVGQIGTPTAANTTDRSEAP